MESGWSVTLTLFSALVVVAVHYIYPGPQETDSGQDAEVPSNRLSTIFLFWGGNSIAPLAPQRTKNLLGRVAPRFSSHIRMLFFVSIDEEAKPLLVVGAKLGYCNCWKACVYGGFARHIHSTRSLPFAFPIVCEFSLIPPKSQRSGIRVRLGYQSFFAFENSIFF